MKHFRAFLCAAAGLAVFLLAFGQDVSPTAEPTERSTVEPIVVLGGEFTLAAKMTNAMVHEFDGANHGFGVLKSSSRSREDVWKEAVDVMLG